jgi:hypothetical protein
MEIKEGGLGTTDSGVQLAALDSVPDGTIERRQEYRRRVAGFSKPWFRCE